MSSDSGKAYWMKIGASIACRAWARGASSAPGQAAMLCAVGLLLVVGAPGARAQGAAEAEAGAVVVDAPSPQPPAVLAPAGAPPEPGPEPVATDAPSEPLPRLTQTAPPPRCASGRKAVSIPEDAPRLTVLVDGLAAAAAQDPALAEGFLALEAPIGFPIDPRRPDAQELMDRVRAAGHEAVLRAPLSAEYGTVQYDAGEEQPAPALHTGLIVADNLGRIQRALESVSGYTGVFVGRGAPVTNNAAVVKPLLMQLALEECVLVDGRGAQRSIVNLLAKRLNAPTAMVTAQLRPKQDARAMFSTLERAANALPPGQGAVVLAEARPEALAALRWWLDGRITTQTVVAPLSAQR